MFICIEDIKAPMREEAAKAGFYKSDFQDTKHPRLQLMTIAELMDGKRLDLPALASMSSQDATFKKAPKTKRPGKKNENLELE